MRRRRSPRAAQLRTGRLRMRLLGGAAHRPARPASIANVQKGLAQQEQLLADYRAAREKKKPKSFTEWLLMHDVYNPSSISDSIAARIKASRDKKGKVQPKKKK